MQPLYFAIAKTRPILLNNLLYIAICFPCQACLDPCCQDMYLIPYLTTSTGHFACDTTPLATLSLCHIIMVIESCESCVSDKKKQATLNNREIIKKVAQQQRYV